MKTTVYLDRPEWALGGGIWTYASKATAKGEPYAGYISDRWCWARVVMDGKNVTRVEVWSSMGGPNWSGLWEAGSGVPPLSVEAAKAIAVLNANVSVNNTVYASRPGLRAVMGSPE